MDRRWALLLAAVAFSDAACGDSAAGGSGDAVLRGVVRDLESGAPIPNATVRSAPATEALLTGDDGSFALREGVRFSQLYRVFAERDGYASSFADFTPRRTEPDRRITLELQRLRICTPGSARCAEGGMTEAVERCVDEGARFETSPCADSEICRVDRCVAARTLSVVANGGLVNSQPVGISCSPNCEARFQEGSLVTLVAQPFAGGSFNGWSAPCPNPEAMQCPLTLSGDVTVTANFDQSAFPLSVDFAGDGEGRVRSEPTGIDCTEDCMATFERDVGVSLTAEPAAGSVFAGWGGDCAGMACALTLDRARRVEARFQVDRNRLTVTRSGAGAVTSMPAGIDCGSECSFDFPVGAVVELSAMAAAQNDFVGWSGDCDGTGRCTVTMDSDRSVDARFEGQSFELTVTTSGPGAGVVRSDPSGVDCGADCDETFGAGVEVTLTASVALGNRFAGWSGDCAGTDACVLTMDQARAVDARFEIESRSVELSVTGGGRVRSDPPGLDCPGTCSFDFGLGAQVELLAAPDAGQALRSWGGACQGRSPCIIDLQADASVDADFVDFFLVPLPDDMACRGGYGVDASARLQNDCRPVDLVEVGAWSSVASRSSELGDGYRTSGPGAALDTGLSLPPGATTVELTARRRGNAFGGLGYGLLVADRGAQGPGVELRMHDDGRLSFVSFSGTATTTVQTSTGALAPNLWGHVAVSTDGTDVDLILDGQVVATGALSWSASSSTAWIGGGPEPSSTRAGLNGDVDEIRISDVDRY